MTPSKKKKIVTPEQRYVAVLLESIEHKLQVVVEATKPIPDMQRTLDMHTEEIGSIKVELAIIKETLNHKADKQDILNLVQRMKVLERAVFRS